MRISSITYPLEVKSIDIGESIEMAYMDSGVGNQTIVFLHGLANYAASWRRQIEFHSGTFRCIAPDLPGNGLSSGGDFPFTMTFYAECIKRFLDRLQCGPVTLVGHSMGGQAGLMMALRYPELVERLVLIAPAGVEHFNVLDKMLMKNMMQLGDYFCSDELHLETAIRESFEQQSEDTGILIDELKAIMNEQSLGAWRKMCTASLNAMIDEPVYPYLKQVACNTLILFGANDKLIPNKMLHPFASPETVAIEAAVLIPKSDLRIIKGAGHFVHIERSKEVNDFISGFMEVHH